jgi:hypothetical protein
MAAANLSTQKSYSLSKTANPISHIIIIRLEFCGEAWSNQPFNGKLWVSIGW